MKGEDTSISIYGMRTLQWEKGCQASFHEGLRSHCDFALSIILKFLRTLECAVRLLSRYESGKLVKVYHLSINCKSLPLPHHTVRGPWKSMFTR